MLKLLWLIPAFPLIGFLGLVLLGRRITGRPVAVLGVGSVGVSACFACGCAIEFVCAPPPGHAYSQKLWTWMDLTGFSACASLYLDALSLIMVLVVTVVGFLIHLYSAEFMAEDKGYSRFFAYMNLFVAAMLILVLADNMALLYVGWEGVGLCSYLLIGFWYREPANARAAIKAFLMTRVGDTALLIGIFFLFASFGTVQIQELLQRAAQEWAFGSTLAILAAALLLGGALGKSAQLPLQTWLPDAMAGPTPVSALIHAATMVTAGVYLIARTHAFFALAPVVQTAVAVIGALTLLLAGCSALVQSDIKRVLAYSTMSQIGYMFLALGVGAWSAAMFHFFTHAFFKSLLFLAAGAVIMSTHHEQDMFKLGGLRAQLPLTFWTFLAGSASLAAIPLITDGFYSKDQILWYAWSSQNGGPWLWAAGVAGTLITGVYSFRMVFLTFFGPSGVEVSRVPGNLVRIPLVVLAVLSLVAGFMELPHSLGNVRLFSDFLHTVLPSVELNAAGADKELVFQIFCSSMSMAGICLAYIAFVARPEYAEWLSGTRLGSALHGFWYSGWKFDQLYEALFLRPFIWMAHRVRKDIIDPLFDDLAQTAEVFHYLLSATQTGRVRHYALGIALGAVITLGIVVFS